MPGCSTSSHDLSQATETTGSRVSHTEEKKQSKSQQLKKIFQYGTVGVSLYTGISLISLGIFYMVVSSGVDMSAVPLKLGFKESLVQSKMAAGTSTFVVAYAIHKLFAPLRIGITTTLHWTCVNGHAELVTLLADRNCQLDIHDSENRTPPMKAGLTPLLLAITKRSEEIVEFLVTKNANANSNAVDKYKCTALMLAICHGSSEIVGILLQQNIDICAGDVCGMTAEGYAVASRFNP
ncbi:hypothetical protein H8959_011319 [Pygathrix nigripes]